MREILFRGKRVRGGEWVFGSFVSPNRIAVRIGEEIYASDIVSHETVGQFTGLYDKKGTRIFEGDILSDGDDTYKVVFDEGVFQIENSHYTTGVYVAIHIDKIDEVIGDVYNNPELLEVEK